MARDATKPQPIQYELLLAEGGLKRLVLPVCLEAETVAIWWVRLVAEFSGETSPRLEVAADLLERCDGAGIALLQALKSGQLTSGTPVRVLNLRPELQRLVDTLSAEEFQKCRPNPDHRVGQVEETGMIVSERFADGVEQVSFLGAVTSGLMANVRHPQRMRWGEIARVFEVAGVNALPIVSLISLLVGAIIAFESAGPFEIFGARLFIANMIGIIMTRELGPLMTAIILAGRSGAAFAAELGTMKVNEELNALETMGLNPVRFLVVQRVIAGVLLTPFLTVYSMLMGIGGGVLVMTTMGFPLAQIYHQMTQSLGIEDVVHGVLKAFVFGAIVAMVGCIRGLQTRGGPAAVGESTTRAVVTTIVLVVVADAVFALVAYVT
jgi:phospholipid/cholesterol/gamma-HCH transport system permease protein